MAEATRHSSLSQAASLGVAAATSLALMLFPFLLRGVPAAQLHTGLPILMFGVAGAFVYGIGYRPDNAIVRFLFGRAFSWLMIVAGYAILFAPGLAVRP